MDMSALAGSVTDDIAELWGRLDLLEARHAVGAGKRGPVDLSGVPREVDARAHGGGHAARAVATAEVRRPGRRATRC